MTATSRRRGLWRSLPTEIMPATKSKASAQICAVVGSDESEVKRVAKDLAVRMTPAAGGDFASDVIDGVADNADQAATRIHQTIEALLTFPFFGGEKLVWLKSATSSRTRRRDGRRR